MSEGVYDLQRRVRPACLSHALDNSSDTLFFARNVSPRLPLKKGGIRM